MWPREEDEDPARFHHATSELCALKNLPERTRPVNTILSEGDVNIDSQQLHTWSVRLCRDRPGRPADTELRLRELEETVEVRVIVTT